MADAKVIILTHGFNLSYHIGWPRKATTTDAQRRILQHRNKSVAIAVSDHLSQKQRLVQSHLAKGKKFSSQVLERCAYVIDLVVDDKEAVVYSCACGS